MMTGAINLISRIKKDELFRGSFVLVIMIGLYNFFNYLFQLSMARMLTLTEYSIFSVLMSLVYIIAIPSEAIQTIIAKNTSKLNAERNTGKIKYLILEGLKKGIIYSGIIFILSIPILFVISSLLKIKISLILITMLSVIFAFTLSITRGALQGNKKFFKLGLNSSLESFFKLLFSIFLVYIGLEVYGAIVAVLIGATIALFFSYLSLKDIFKQKKEKCEFNGLLKQNMPILIIMTSIVLIYSLDVIFARIFFSPDLAGKYSFVSLIGKTILFMGFAIGKTMLPISSGNFEKRRGTFGLFKKSFLMISIISLVALLVFYFFPTQIIQILSLGDTKYLDISNILIIVGLSYSFLSLSYIISLYQISINKIKRSQYVFILFVLLEVLLLSLYHQNLFNFSLAITVTNLGLFIYTAWLMVKR